MPNSARSISRRKPKVLYHYTSFAGFQGIIESKSLWATDIRYLNDVSEFKHAISLANDVVEGVLTDDFDPNLLSLFKRAVDTISNSSQLATCVASFSENRDMLSQWRGYCHDGRGVCLGIRSSNLRHLEDESNLVSLSPCEYKQAKQRALVEGALADVIDFIERPKFKVRLDREIASSKNLFHEGGTINEEEKSRITNLVASAITEEMESSGQSAAVNLFAIASLIKHSSFFEEAEWRLVVPVVAGSDKERLLRFRLGRSGLVPYLALSLPPENQKLVIEEIVVGPTLESELSINAIKKFLFINDVQCGIVRGSEVPYRNW